MRNKKDNLKSKHSVASKNKNKVQMEIDYQIAELTQNPGLTEKYLIE